MRLAGVCLGTDDLGAAECAYQLLLGVPAAARSATSVRFVLRHGSVDLVPGQAFRALRFVADEVAAPVVVSGVPILTDAESDALRPVLMMTYSYHVLYP